MSSPFIDRPEIQRQLATFFSENRSEIAAFGSTVNQTFEAFVFASIVNWYKRNGWQIEFIHPTDSQSYVKLKFSTRGAPDKFTYTKCTKGSKEAQIRHGLRVATRYHQPGQTFKANVVLDVAVIANKDLSKHKSDDHIDNVHLYTFGEAKHMSAFAELVANFIGLVHEIASDKITNIRLFDGFSNERKHPAPFLYVSGNLNPTAKGIVETIKARGYDIDVYDYKTGPDAFGVALPSKLVKRTKKTKEDNLVSVAPSDEVPF